MTPIVQKQDSRLRRGDKKEMWVFNMIIFRIYEEWRIKALNIPVASSWQSLATLGAARLIWPLSWMVKKNTWVYSQLLLWKGIHKQEEEGGTVGWKWQACVRGKLTLRPRHTLPPLLCSYSLTRLRIQVNPYATRTVKEWKRLRELLSFPPYPPFIPQGLWLLVVVLDWVQSMLLAS